METDEKTEETPVNPLAFAEREKEFNSDLAIVLQEALNELPLSRILCALQNHYTHLMLLGQEMQGKRIIQEVQKALEEASAKSRIVLP